MTDKQITPDAVAIREHLGQQAAARLTTFESGLQTRYDLAKELKFPFGNSYGWGYKYTHRTKHLCYAFFEKDAFTVTLQLGSKIAPRVDDALPSLLPKTRGLWEHRYPCGERGGWIHYRVLGDEELDDVFCLLALRQKPL